MARIPEDEPDSIAETRRLMKEAKQSDETSGKSRLHWTAFVLPPAMYIILYVILDILIAHSAMNGSYEYDPMALIILTEGAKLLISASMWGGSMYYQYKTTGKPWQFNDSWKYYGIPAVMYTIWSVLNFESLLHVSLATFSVLYQSVVFFTAISWAIAFGERITLKQWCALTLLCAGCMCAQITPDMKFNLTYAATYVFSQAMLSSVASVYNEVLLKKPGQDVNEQNTYLYFFTTLCSLGWVLISDPGLLAPHRFFIGFDGPNAIAIVLLAAFIGMLVTLILKYTNVIVKVYAQAFHAPLEIILAHYTIHTPLGVMALMSSVVILFSSLLYYGEKFSQTRLPWEDEVCVTQGTKAEKEEIAVKSKAVHALEDDAGEHSLDVASLLGAAARSSSMRQRSKQAVGATVV